MRTFGYYDSDSLTLSLYHCIADTAPTFLPVGEKPAWKLVVNRVSDAANPTAAKITMSVLRMAARKKIKY